MTTVIVLTADLQGDPSDLIKAFKQASKASDDFVRDSQNDSQRANGAWDGIKKGAGLMAGALATYFSAKVITDFVNDSITAAANLQQSGGAVDAVFKESSGVVKQWSKDAADAVGLSSDAYNQYASLIGTQMKTAGFDIEEAAYRTQDLIGISADLSSMFGGTTADAVSALGAAFRGEYDSIEKYGLAIKEGDINARLAAKGLDDLTGEQARNARAVELQAMIMEQSKDSLGNFAKEADTLQGQQQRLTAEFENQQAALGTALLPAMTALAGFARDVLPGAFNVLNTAIQSTIQFAGDVQQWFEENQSTIQALATIIGSAAVAYGIYFAVVNAGAAAMAIVQAATKAWTAVQWLLNAAMTANPLGLIITLIGALVGAIIWVATQTTFFQDAWAAVSQFLIDTWTNISTFFSTIWQGVVQVFTDAWNSIVNFLTPIFEFIAGLIRGYVEIYINIFLVLAAVLKTIWDAIVTAATWVWEQISSFVTPIVEGIASFITDTIRNVQVGWQVVWGAISNYFAQVWTNIQNFLRPAVMFIVNTILPMIRNVQAGWNSVWSGIGSFFSTIWNNIVNAVRTAINTVVSVVTTIQSRIMGVLNGVGQWLVNAGSDLIRGFWNGISDMWGWITSQIGGFFDGIVGWAKDVLGIASPSKVFAEIGRFVGKGFAVGLKGSEAEVMAASRSMIDKIRKGLDAGEISQKAARASVLAIQNGTRAIVGAIREREKALKSLVEARKTLEQLREDRASFIASVTDKITDLGDIGGQKSSTSMIDGLKKQIEAVRSFRATLDKLTKLGLDDTSRDQLLADFMQDGSTASADALLAGGKTAVKQVSSLQSELARQGKLLGTTVGNDMYNAGIQAATGLVKGLQSQEKALKAVADGMADSLVRAVKTKLGIKSPSTVFAEVGDDSVAGYVRGVDRRQADAVLSVERMAQAVAKSKALSAGWDAKLGAGTYGTPPWMPSATAGPVAAGGTTEINIEIKIERGEDDDVDTIVAKVIHALQFELGGVVSVP